MLETAERRHPKILKEQPGNGEASQVKLEEKLAESGKPQATAKLHQDIDMNIILFAVIAGLEGGRLCDVLFICPGTPWAV